MELVGVGRLPHVELGLPGGETRASAVAVAGAALLVAGVVVEVIEEAEERGEGGVVGVVVEVAREERHCARLLVGGHWLEWCGALEGSGDSSKRR